MNVVEEGDTLFTSSLDSVHLVTTTNDFVKHDLIIHSETYFHVTSNNEYFESYDAKKRG